MILEPLLDIDESSLVTLHITIRDAASVRRTFPSVLEKDWIDGLSPNVACFTSHTAILWFYQNDDAELLRVLTCQNTLHPRNASIFTVTTFRLLISMSFFRDIWIALWNFIAHYYRRLTDANLVKCIVCGVRNASGSRDATWPIPIQQICSLQPVHQHKK